MSTVYVPIEKKLDRQIDVCRKGAQTNRSTIVLVTKPRNAAPHSDPSTWTRVIEITPHGDVCELPAEGLRTTLGDHLTAVGLGGFVTAIDTAAKEHRAKRDAKREHFRKLASDKRKAMQAAAASKVVAA